MRLLLLSHPEVNPRARSALLRAFAADAWEVVEARPEQVRVVAVGGAVRVQVLGADRLPDAVVGRTVARYLDLLRPAYQVWQDSGVIVLNGDWARRLGRDKLAMAVVLARAGVPIVDTVGLLPDIGALSRTEQPGALEVPELAPNLGVLKPARGHSGQLVTLAADSPAVARFWRGMRARASETAVEPVLAQPLVVGSGDLRAYVVAGECVGIMRRHPGAEGEWRANARLGARCSPLPLDHPGAALAERAVAVLGLDAAGVDLIGADDDLRVLEVDGWAGFDHLAATTGADVPSRISAFLRAEARRQRSTSEEGKGGSL
ncbi:MAG: hypothetical protein RLZ55_1260 [Actinomycetota bacterium]|jgi:glutathione synthase/RimK-type ligase-like ATP-grasp enzyme